MNITRLILDNNYDLFIPIPDDCIKLKNNHWKTFLLYFNLPNSPITIINDDDDDDDDDDKLISPSESDSDTQTSSDT